MLKKITLSISKGCLSSISQRESIENILQEAIDKGIQENSIRLLSAYGLISYEIELNDGLNKLFSKLGDILKDSDRSNILMKAVYFLETRDWPITLRRKHPSANLRESK